MTLLPRCIAFDVGVFLQATNLAMWNASFQLLAINYICGSFTVKLKSARKAKNVEIGCIRHVKKSGRFKRPKRKGTRMVIGSHFCEHGCVWAAPPYCIGRVVSDCAVAATRPIALLLWAYRRSHVRALIHCLSRRRGKRRWSLGFKCLCK